MHDAFPLNFCSSKTRHFKIAVFFFAFLLVTNSCSYFTSKEQKVPFKEVRTVVGIESKIGEPFGIAVKDGEVFVSDGENGKILRISQDGKVETFTDKLDTPSQIAFDELGNLIVADSGDHLIKRILQNGEVEIIAGVEDESGFKDGEANRALFNAPIGIAVFGNKIFVADSYNDRIRLITEGKVLTLAGSEKGFIDGQEAQFDTPTGLAMSGEKLLIGDSGNRKIRVVEPDGRVWTLAGDGTQRLKDGLLSEAAFVNPTAFAVGNSGEIYVADGNAIRVIGRRFLPVVETISNSERGFSDGKLRSAKFNRPSGLSFDEKGNLFVADSGNQLVRVFTGYDLGKRVSDEDFDKAQVTAKEFREISKPRWTYDPPEKGREIAGTLGEIRGKIKGEDSQAWFHNGLDIVGGYGETARFIRDEKVLRPSAVENFETVRELIRMPTLGYIHIRLGRDSKSRPFEDKRFQFSLDEDGKPNGVRIPRGTKFKAGDAIGTLNKYNHVHLIAGRTGREMNALDALTLPQVADTRAPKIESVSIFDKDWDEIETGKGNERIKLFGKIRIVVKAFDQMDGNAARRKLGLYKLGYQVFDENEKALKGFENPKWTIKFDKTPENSVVELVYAEGSQSGATGETVFNYIATNEVSGKIRKESFFDTDKLEKGKYTLRVFAADFFGNTASEDITFSKE